MAGQLITVERGNSSQRRTCASGPNGRAKFANKNESTGRCIQKTTVASDEEALGGAQKEESIKTKSKTKLVCLLNTATLADKRLGDRQAYGPQCPPSFNLFHNSDVGIAGSVTMFTVPREPS